MSPVFVWVMFGWKAKGAAMGRISQICLLDILEGKESVFVLQGV